VVEDAERATNLLFNANDIDGPIIISDRAIANNEGRVAVLIQDFRLDRLSIPQL